MTTARIQRYMGDANKRNEKAETGSLLELRAARRVQVADKLRHSPAVPHRLSDLLIYPHLKEARQKRGYAPAYPASFLWQSPMPAVITCSVTLLISLSKRYT